MSITLEEVDYIASLARLAFSKQEKIHFQKELGKILDYMSKLNELDTSGIEPLCHPLGLVNVLREDKVKPSLSPEEALKNAPVRQENFFKVPKVIK